MDLDELYALWSSGRSLEAGEHLSAAIPVPEQPMWAARVLILALPLITPEPAVDAVVSLVGEPARWAEAHDAFTNVRLLVLREERLAEAGDKLRIAVLMLAELVAKITYNASGAPRPFDADTAPWLAATARSVITHMRTPALEVPMWRALVEPVVAAT